MTESRQTLPQSEGLAQGPMIGGTTVNLGFFRSTNDLWYSVCLQFGGEVPCHTTSSSEVNGVWTKAPAPPPSKAPVVVFMPAGGRPRSTYEAATIVDLGRCAAPFSISSLWNEGTVHFAPLVVERLAASIEASIPVTQGQFLTQWVAAADGPEVPF